MRILITGGAGFIGSHIADEAISNEHEVCIIDNLSSGRIENIPKGAHFVKLDIRDADKLSSVFNDFKPEVVNHQAAQTSVAISTRYPILDADINIMGSLNLIEESIKHNVKQFVFASTGGAIYGEISGDRLATENDVPSPISPYACSKFAIENYLKCFSLKSNMLYTILRYANVYGPRQNPHGEAGVVAIFANNVIQKLPIRINARNKTGDDGCIRDYVYVSDVVKANILACESRITIPVLNVGTGVGISTNTLLNNIKSLIDSNVKVTYGPYRPGDVQRSVLDSTQFKNILGDSININDGILNTVEWFVKNKT